MTDCEIDNNDTKLMQLSNDLNSYCVNERINSDNTDLVRAKTLNMSASESFSKHLFKSGSVLSLFTLSLEHSPKSVLSE
jgi:hypothetical protein